MHLIGRLIDVVGFALKASVMLVAVNFVLPEALWIRKVHITVPAVHIAVVLGLMSPQGNSIEILLIAARESAGNASMHAGLCRRRSRASTLLGLG
jgi:hypothetical protein